MEQQEGIPQGLGCGENEQPSRVRGERLQLAPEALFDPGGERVARLTNDPGGRFGRRQRSGKLDQRKRISVRLSEEAFPDGAIEVPDEHRIEQGTRL
jgi:hypothetical protein